jgi:hypothetical protein
MGRAAETAGVAILLFAIAVAFITFVGWFPVLRWGWVVVVVVGWIGIAAVAFLYAEEDPE